MILKLFKYEFFDYYFLNKNLFKISLYHLIYPTTSLYVDSIYLVSITSQI